MSVFSRLQLACVCSVAAALTGCAQSPLGTSLAEMARQDLGELHARDRLLLEQLDGRQPSATRAGAVDIQDASTADDFVQLALTHNPAITSAHHRVKRFLERIPQVTSLADPMFSITPIGDMAETASGQVQLMTGVSQRFPFPGKLDARGRIAEQEVAMAEQNLARVRLSVIADTRQAYWSLYYAVRSIAITRQSRNLVIQLRDVARSKVRAGTATQAAVLRASVEISNLDNELLTFQQRKSSAASALNALIDRPVEALLPDPEPIDITRFDAKLADLLDSAQRTSPELQIVREQIGRYREQRALARFGDLPDFKVGLGYNLVDDSGTSPVADGSDQWWISFGISIPIWKGRTEAAKREAMLGILESTSQLQSEQNRVAFRVQDAFTRVETQQRQAALLYNVIVPEATLAVESSLSGYRTGRVDFLTLIDNWRKLLDFQLMYQGSLTALEQSFADLQRAVGHDLARHTTPTDDQSTDPQTDPAANPEDRR